MTIPITYAQMFVIIGITETMNSQGKHPLLGNKIAIFRNRPTSLRIWLLFILPAGLLTTFSFTYGLLLAGNAFQQHGPAMALLRARGWIAIGTVVLIVLAAYLLFLLLLSFQRIEIFDDGIRYRNSLLQERIYMWSEIYGISSSATRSTILGRSFRTIPSGRIIPKNGKPIDLSNQLEGVPNLIRIIKSKVYPLLWTEMKTGFLEGECLQFGRIALDKTYLSIAKKRIPWTTVKKIGVDSGFLVIDMYRGSSGRVPLSQILNLELLLKVVDWGFQV